MDFSNYSVRDFVLNESFQKWVLEPDEETGAVWDKFLDANPGKTEAVVEARTMIRNIYKAIDKNIARDRNDVWERLMKDIDELDSETDLNVRQTKNKE